MLHPGALALQSLVLKWNGLLFSRWTGTKWTHESWIMLAGKVSQCRCHSELFRELLGRDTLGGLRTAIFLVSSPPHECTHCRDMSLFNLAFSVASAPACTQQLGSSSVATSLTLSLYPGENCEAQGGLGTCPWP